MARIAVTADIHFDPSGYHTPPEDVRDLAARMRAQCPDAIVLGGDLGHPSKSFAGCLAAFSGSSVPVAVLAGNHDVWRDERGWSSRELWLRRLPRLTEEAGLVWLESTTLRLGEVAIVGSLAWYDYSAAPTSLPYPAEYYADIKASLNNDGRWIDWPWSDLELSAALRAGLVGRLEGLETDAGVRSVLLVTHVPLFEEQIVRKPGDRRWELSNAYFGNLRTGQAVLRFSKLAQVISGHTHFGKRALVQRPPLPDLPVSVVGSDYGSPAFEMVELP